MADEINNYEQFVVVAETEWKFDYGDFETSRPKIAVCNGCDRPNGRCQCGRPIRLTENPRITKHSLKMGTIDWNIAFNDQTKKLEFTCQSVADGSVDEHMEFVHYCRSQPNESYEKGNTIRRIFTSSANSLTFGLYLRDNIFTIRILKNRPMFPDFTSKSTVIGGRWGSDLKLRVVDQLFHVNKQLLSVHSDYFDRMFNGKFKEANQEEVELKHENADPALFHDFLLAIFVPDALPNPKNVAALFILANMYEVDSVRMKCHSHLTMCREMPVEQRYMLALENGSKELQRSIRRNAANFEEAERIIAAVSEKAVAL